MKILFHPSFGKPYGKLRESERSRVEDRILLFSQDPFHPLLRNHALTGKYRGYRSVSVGGDLRVIFKMVSRDTTLVITIGTHTQLYDH